MNVKQLLILHNGSKRNSANHIAHRFSGLGFEIVNYWVFNEEFPAQIDGFCGVFITGSPHGAYEDILFIQQEHRLLNQIAERNIPMLGVCFGSQILASALCGREQVFRRSSCEVGFKRLTLTDFAPDDPLLRQMPAMAPMFVWHNDEVCHDHPDMRILASSDQCPNQIWRYRKSPIWGIQGHPELTKELAIKLFDVEADIFRQDGADPETLKQAAIDTPEALGLLAKFGEICHAGIKRD